LLAAACESNQRYVVVSAALRAADLARPAGFVAERQCKAR